MAFCVLDCNKCEAYPLQAGLHRQSVLTDRIIEALKVFIFSA